MSTIGGIEYQELLGSGGGVRQGRIDSRTRIFLVEWDSRGDFLLGLYGYVVKTGNTYEREMPLPFAPGSALYAKSHTLEGLACDGVDSHGNIHYQYARLVVQYGPLDQEDTEEDEPWIQIAIRSRVEFLPIPAWGLEWTSDSVALDQDQVAAFPLVFHQITLARYNVAAVSETLLSAYVGTLNDAIFRGLAIGCVQFAGWSSQRTVDTDGETVSYNLIIELAARSKPWDYMWRPNAGWAQVRRVDNTALFTYSDFSAIGNAFA